MMKKILLTFVIMMIMCSGGYAIEKPCKKPCDIVNADSLSVTGPIDYNSDSTRIFVAEGDSLTEGPPEWVTPLSAINGVLAGHTFTNIGASNDRYCPIDTAYATTGGGLYASSKDAESGYYFVWAGTNDLDRTNTPVEIYACAVSLWAKAKADNYKVGAFTVTPRGDDTYDGETTTPIVIDDCVGTNFGVTAHDMVKDQRIQASVGSECNLTEGETYYVLSVVGVDDITISETVDGAAKSGDSDASITTSLGKLTYEEFRNQLNALILSDKTLYDYLIRPDILFPDSTDVNYYAGDTIHLLQVAHDLLAQSIEWSLSQPSLKMVSVVSADRTLTGFQARFTFGSAGTDTTTSADKLVIESATAPKIQLLAPEASGISTYGFSNPTTNDIAGMNYNTTTGDIHFETNSSKRLVIDFAGNIGVGAINTPTAQLHVDQSDSSGAEPVLKLDQADIDDSFVDFIGTSAADGSRSISSDTTEDSAKFGAIRIEINGVTKWIRIYDNES